MVKDVGRKVLIKVGDGAGPEVFNNLVSLTAKTMALNGETVNLTDHDSVDGSGQLWQNVTGEGAVTSMTVGGDGRVSDDATLLRLNTVFLTETRLFNAKVVVPALGTYSAEFCLTSLEFSAGDDATFSMSITNNGAVTFA